MTVESEHDQLVRLQERVNILREYFENILSSIPEEDLHAPSIYAKCAQIFQWTLTDAYCAARRKQKILEDAKFEKSAAQLRADLKSLMEDHYVLPKMGRRATSTMGTEKSRVNHKRNDSRTKSRSKP